MEKVFQVDSSGVDYQITIDKDQLCGVKQHEKNVIQSLIVHIG